MELERILNRKACKYNFTYKVENYPYNTQRAIIKCEDINRFLYLRSMLWNTKGIKVDYWYVTDNFFEGRIYVMTCEDFEHKEVERKKELERNWNWWTRYNNANVETKKLMACGAIE